MPKHIFFQQRTNDIIWYITDEMEDPNLMKYKEFKGFLAESFYLDDWQPMIDALDSFQKVFIDMRTNKWRKIPDEIGEHSFDDLYALNKPPEPAKTFNQKTTEAINTLYNKIGRRDDIQR